MDIKGIFYGYARDNYAAFIVRLESGIFKHERIIKLKSATVNAAELYAAEYALSAIADKHVYVELMTCNAYVPKMLDKDSNGKYIAKPEKNKELVTRVRSLADNFSHLHVITVPAQTVKELQNIIRNDAKQI
ncbi:MAG: hypothetical protein QXP41_00545 [Candidatus Nitrosocaldus sp.]